ncbi:hypothetical protein JOM56_014741 [Amanita muscaria]
MDVRSLKPHENSFPVSSGAYITLTRPGNTDEKPSVDQHDNEKLKLLQNTIRQLEYLHARNAFHGNLHRQKRAEKIRRQTAWTARAQAVARYSAVITTTFYATTSEMSSFDVFTGQVLFALVERLATETTKNAVRNNGRTPWIAELVKQY